MESKTTLLLSLEELKFLRDALQFYENDSGKYDDKLGEAIFSQFPDNIDT
jgi:hypothetical protein